MVEVTPPAVRPASRARRGDPDWSGVTARAITAPPRAGPEVLPCAGRATLHGRRAALRAGRSRLRPCAHLLQSAFAVEPVHALAVRIFAAGERDLLPFLFREAQAHRALADGALRLPHGLTLRGILRLVGDEAARLCADGADEEWPVGPDTLDKEASGAPLRHALRAIERTLRPGQCTLVLHAPPARQRLHRRAGDLRDEVGHHRAYLPHERLTLVLTTHHPCQLLLPLPRQLRRREQRRAQHRDERHALRRRHQRLLLTSDVRPLEQRLNNGGARRRGPQARVLHGKPQLVVVHLLAG